MKKYFILFLAVVLAVSLGFMGVSCKAEEAAAEEEVVAEEEVAAEEAAEEEVVEKPFEGITLKVITIADLLTPEIDKKFEELTGAKIEAETVSFMDLLPKLTTAFVAESADFDLFLMGPIHAGKFGEGGWYVPVNDLITPEDMEDIIPVYLDMYTWEGDLVGMPLNACPFMLFYNSKILSDAGLDPAKTWEELADQSMQLQEAGVVDYGITWPFLSGDDMSMDVWSLVMMSLGGKLFDENGDLAFNSEEGVRAIEILADSMIKDKWANPASLEVEKMESMKNFTNGIDAYNLNWQFMFPMTIDPEQSIIADYSKMAMVPIEPGAEYSSWTTGAAYGVNPFISDEQKEASIEYLKVFGDKENALQLLKDKAWLPMWKSVYDDPECNEINPDIPALKEQLTKAAMMLTTPWFPEFKEILRLEIAPALAGDISAQEALDSAEQKILQRIEENWE